MDQLATFLQAVGYHAVQIQPFLPMNFHLILSALFPIYTGAHASLTRPVSAAKPSKTYNEAIDDDEDDDEQQKMEGMSPLDAILLPLLAGTTLAGLYFIIKWLEDPAILNKILNWYFSIFGTLALARLITDTMGTVTSVAFPCTYSFNGEVWNVDGKSRKVRSSAAEPESSDSPLPGSLSTVPLPAAVKDYLWTIRNLPAQKLHIRFYIHKFAHGSFKIGPQGLISFLLAIVAQAYFNLVSKPWWLTNALGFSFAYNTLQLMSPTTSWTGTLILGALFVYDIYFVFFTPLMVTVATQLDIPAKLLFPRPASPGDDPAKQAMSMLGLGDIILPGMMIGFALRFDLYLFYLRKQIRKEITPSTKGERSLDRGTPPLENVRVEKDKYYPATAAWGERLWTSRAAMVTSPLFHGSIFPKTYFYASLIGYVLGMLTTLIVMQIFHHAQPALLYLVPGVLGALWGTAYVKGDLRALWEYSEAEEEEGEANSNGGDKDRKGGGGWHDWKSVFFGSESNTQHSNKKSGDEKEDGSRIEELKEDANPKQDCGNSEGTDAFHRNRKSELLFFSVSLPGIQTSTSAESHTTRSSKDET